MSEKDDTFFDEWWYGEDPEDDDEIEEEYWDSEDRWDVWNMLEDDLNDL